MHAFCACGRDHKWIDDPKVTVIYRRCRCGRVLEAQTKAEYTSLRDAHAKMLTRMTAYNDLDGPTIKLFRD
jgi:hypothetical protein